MTVLWSQWQPEVARGKPGRTWCRVPTRLLKFTKMPIGPKGWAEIKPHNEGGIRGGLRQLGDKARGPKGTTPMALITYLPFDPATSLPVGTGYPPIVRVFATAYTGPGTPGDYLERQWYDLGSFKPHRLINLDVDNGGLFGAAIEEPVRNLFKAKVLAPKRTFRGGGGSGKGPDVLWDELAKMYAELAWELRDPLYEELASELAALAYGDRRYAA